MTRSYTVIIERGTSSWGAYVPDLPGCVAAGRTEAEVRKLIREAVALHIEDLQASWRRIPAARHDAEQVAVMA
ncbi:MAG TPA: type II toxin-antitoxin system HicB family antitoxin [Kiritimatiellia bacterium]|nr:type II toxin-antitoxin system HicB family antitoxin [Kiritimatiellia bacterium]